MIMTKKKQKMHLGVALVDAHDLLDLLRVEALPLQQQRPHLQRVLYSGYYYYYYYYILLLLLLLLFLQGTKALPLQQQRPHLGDYIIIIITIITIITITTIVTTH